MRGFLAIATAVATLMTVASPSHAVTLASVADPAGDVTHFDEPGLSASSRDSIDIHRVTVTRADGHARIRIRVKDLRVQPEPGDWDQIFHVLWQPAPGNPAKLRGSLGFAAGDHTGFAGSYDPRTGQGGEDCEMRVRWSLAEAWIRANLPRRCLVPGRLDIVVWSTTGHWGSDAPPYSEDRLGLPVRVRVYS